MILLKQAEYMAATGFIHHPTIAFRSGLGPYKGQVEGFDFHPVDNRWLHERLNTRMHPGGGSSNGQN